MMKLLGFAALAFATSLMACSDGGEGKVEIEAAKTALTDQGKDKLFTVKIVEAPADGYGLEAMSVKVLIEGKEPITLSSCTALDANTNTKIDKDDKLECAEGEANVLGVDLAGKELEVEVYAKVDGNDKLVGKADWTVFK
jgi:hypothetical protein